MKTNIVNNWRFEYCGSMAMDWHTAAAEICENLPTGTKQPSDGELYNLVEKICKNKGYDINYMPDHIIFIPVF